MNKTPRNRKNEILIEKAYQEIQERIVYRSWNDGHQTHEQEIAEELGANRAHVRQALSRLQHDGLIKVIPRHGVTVVPMSHRDIQEVYQISSRLELLAIELIAEKPAILEQVKSLAKANRDMAKAHAASDIKAWIRADEVFHRGLVTLSRNSVLCEVHKNICGRAQRARLAVLAFTEPPPESSQEHDSVLAALCNGDSQLAKEKLSMHFERVNSFIRTLEEKL